MLKGAKEVTPYKGYLKTKDKKCTTKFSDFVSYEEIRSEREYAGLLAEGITLVDIDDAEQAEVLYDIIISLNIQCWIYETTRGMHFIFKTRSLDDKNATGAKTAIGIKADIKHGHKNSYQILKMNGRKRKLLKQPDDLDVMPIWLEPIRTNADLWDLEEGKRNDTLYGYILTLQKAGFEKSEVRQTYKIINDFILKYPVEDDELETILRNEAFSDRIFFKNKQFLFDEFAQFLKSEYSVKKINNSLCLYEDGVYKYDRQTIEKNMVKHISTLNKSKRQEVLTYLDLIAPAGNPDEYDHLIAFNNGVLNLETGNLLDFSPEYIITNKIPWDYNPKAESPLVNTTLNNIACYKQGIRSLIEEMTGYTMFRRSTLGKAFMLTGEKDNGKSTLLDMITHMLGYQNTSALDLNELSERFKTAELVGKLANIGDDISGEYIQDTGAFKKLVTGNPLNVERKGEHPFDFTNYATLIFSANSLPRLGKGKDNSAIAKRLMIVPLKAKFNKDNPDFDPTIKYKLREKEAMEYLIKIGIEGLKRAIKNKCFTETEETIKELKEYEKSNNPVLGFIEEHQDAIIGETPKSVYTSYKDYCLDYGIHALSGVEFGRQICMEMNVRTKSKRLNGKVQRVYEKENEA